MHAVRPRATCCMCVRVLQCPHPSITASAVRHPRNATMHSLLWGPQLARCACTHMHVTLSVSCPVYAWTIWHAGSRRITCRSSHVDTQQHSCHALHASFPKNASPPPSTHIHSCRPTLSLFGRGRQARHSFQSMLCGAAALFRATPTMCTLSLNRAPDRRRAIGGMITAMQRLQPSLWPSILHAVNCLGQPPGGTCASQDPVLRSDSANGTGPDQAHAESTEGTRARTQARTHARKQASKKKPAKKANRVTQRSACQRYVIQP